MRVDHHLMQQAQEAEREARDQLLLLQDCLTEARQRAERERLGDIQRQLDAELQEIEHELRRAGGN